MRVFGHIPDTEVGDMFENRAALAKSGIHPPTQAGISGGAKEGADSIVLSGGYEDDEDFGDVIIYTGAGGRDENTNKQIADQKLERTNLALARNKLEGLPVRVTRSHRHKSQYSPAKGYQYAGLYRVEDFRCEKGLSGFKVWRFKLILMGTQPTCKVRNETKAIKNTIDNIDKLSFCSKHIYPNHWDLESLRKLNLFIGSNNSGKSRKLREIFTTDINDWLFDFRHISVLMFFESLIYNLNDMKILNFFDKNLSSVSIQKLQDYIKSEKYKSEVIDIRSLASKVYNESCVGNACSYDENLINDILVSRFLKENERNISDVECYYNLFKDKVYIPTLRSLRSIYGEGNSDIFLSITVNDYFRNSSLEDNIFTGHSLYQELVKRLLGTHEQRKKVKEYENYLSDNFFFGQEISLVPMVGKDVVYFKEGDKVERPIYDLGDGIQSIIILTFKVFMAEKPTVFFIEEPEHYLHAGLQRKLIETFSQHEDHLFFMTTHSNHFLDLAQERSDISIQQVRKIESKTVVQATEKYNGLLNDLGVRASSVLLANCSIWVEGVTDKKYLKLYMDKYIQELEESDNKCDVDKDSRLRNYQENLHYVFTEYQGSNITHWDFGDACDSSLIKTPAKKLNKNIFLIADADIEGKSERINVISDNLGAKFHILDRKEIENLIPYNIVIKTAEARWNTFNGKGNCNIRRFTNIKSFLFDDKKKGIGEILERYVTKPKGFNRDFFKDKSGTIKDKVKFCNKATEIMLDPNVSWNLSTELTDLCRKIWDHIEESNA